MKPVFFTTPEEFRSWLDDHHKTQTEIWVGFWKKASGKIGMTYDQALDEALCFGWIDGITKRYDDISYVQRFCPRRPKSVWSKINTQHIARLIKEEKMMPSGLTKVEEAKTDGRWQRAYDSPTNAKIPDDFLKELKKHKAAEEFFKTLNKTNVYHIAYQLQNAKKEETRQKRIAMIIQKLEKKERFY